MRSSKYSDIVAMFKMTDRPEEKFDHKAQEDFKKLVDYALRKSFADFNFRTLTLTKDPNNNNKKTIDEKKGANQTVTDFLINKLSEGHFQEQFISYFQTSPLCEYHFDKWHHDTCELFLRVIRDLKIYEEIEYGKAQKIVNMMFKHLYCLDGADQYAKHFRSCHMVLDNFTLEWFKRDVGEKRIDSWSNLVYKHPAVDHEDYMFYQKKIRNYFNLEKNKMYEGLTPFQAEFYIWPEIQLHMAAEALFSQSIGEDVACQYLEENAKDAVDKFKKNHKETYITDNSTQRKNSKKKLEQLTFDHAKKVFKGLPIEQKMPVIKKIVEQYQDMYKQENVAP